MNDETRDNTIEEQDDDAPKRATSEDLTPEGQLVVDWASELLDAAETFTSSVTSLRAEHRVGLHVAASLTVAEYLMPGWLVALQNRMPKVRASLAVANSADVVERVRHHAVDLGFVESPTVPRDLSRQRLGQDALVVVVASLIIDFVNAYIDPRIRY